MSRISTTTAVWIALHTVPSVLGSAFDVSSLPFTLHPNSDWNTIGPGLYKANSPNPAGEDGTDPLNLFTTVFNLSGADVTGGTVSFNVPGSSLDLDYFVVKAGNEYAKYDTSSVDWSLYDSIVFGGFTPSPPPNGRGGPGAPKSISHVSIYGGYTSPGGDGDPAPIPDNGWTLGFLSAGAAWLFRKQRR